MAQLYDRHLLREVRSLNGSWDFTLARDDQGEAKQGNDADRGGSGDVRVMFPGPDGPVPALRWLTLRQAIANPPRSQS